jgi:energy-coupling factor transporter transmembrane protein EcfT
MTAPIVTTKYCIRIDSLSYRRAAELTIAMLGRGYPPVQGTLWERIAEGRTR